MRVDVQGDALGGSPAISVQSVAATPKTSDRGETDPPITSGAM
jgi:hypothetical protein